MGNRGNAPADGIRLRVISLGAGVQSTTMALMAAHRELTPMPDCAIFADTGAEPAAVYEHLRWLMSDNVLPFEVHVVAAGNLRDEILKATRREGKRGSDARPPFFTANPDGSVGMIRRQCTQDFKIRPIEEKVRALLGLKSRQWWPKPTCVEQWIGISTDEAHRMKPSGRTAIATRWPLIERRMSRGDCLGWLKRNGYPQPPKSACTFCPFHSNEQWRALRDKDPAAWNDAITVDRAIRTGLKGHGLSGFLYVHRDRVPLEFANLGEPDTVDLFGNECEGMCGV